MIADNLPFMHFMVRVDNGRKSRLLAPSEAEDVAGGQFVVPLDDGREFFPVYQFHYSLYLGEGKFFPDENGRKLFRGFGLTLPTDRRSEVLLTFRTIEDPAQLWVPELWGPVRALRAHGEFLLPVMRRVPRRPAIRYGGKMKHKDFRRLFAEVEPTDPKILDRLLDEFHISLIGFDANSVAQRRKKTKSPSRSA